MATPGRAGISAQDKRAIERLAAAGLAKAAIAREVRVSVPTVTKYLAPKKPAGK